MTYLKLIFTAIFWGGTFIAGRLIAPTIDPYSAAFLRFLIASFFLIFLTIKIEGRLPKIDPHTTIIIFLSRNQFY
ncbi:MAG: EamA family transporter [Desulfobacula sp.]|nr:EamA family transporter [Desulfobacula sp.]